MKKKYEFQDCPKCGSKVKGAHGLYCGKTGVDAKKFWEGLDKRADGCWLWTGGVYNHGYGSISWRFKPFERGTKIAASRAAWMLRHGPIPAGMQVLHRCDVPACCNPEHLFLGTVTDNMHDMRRKGRDPRVKLTADQVRALRTEMKEKTYIGARTELAAKYGVSTNTLWKIANGKSFHYIQ